MASRLISPRRVSGLSVLRASLTGLLLGLTLFACIPAVQAQSAGAGGTLYSWASYQPEGAPMAFPQGAYSAPANPGLTQGVSFSGGSYPGVYVEWDLGSTQTIHAASFFIRGNPGFPWIAFSNDGTNWTTLNGGHDSASPYTHFWVDGTTTPYVPIQARYIEYFLGGQSPTIYNFGYS